MAKLFLFPPICILIALAFCSSPALAKEWLLPKDQRRPYPLVRAELIAQGWKPFKVQHNYDIHSPDLDYFCDVGGRICKQTPEILWCQEAGKPSCTMGFYKDSPRRYLVVRGDAEEPPKSMVDEIVTPSPAFVERWFHHDGKRRP